MLILIEHEICFIYVRPGTCMHSKKSYPCTFFAVNYVLISAFVVRLWYKLFSHATTHTMWLNIYEPRHEISNNEAF